MVTYIIVGVFILFDIITGLIKAFYNGGINSTKLRVGFFHKVSEIIALIGSGLLEYGLGFINLDIGLPILSGVALYLSCMELISIIENLCEVNPALATLFKPYLQKLKNKIDKGDD